MTIRRKHSKSKVNVIDLQYSVVKEHLPNFIYKGLKQYSRKANFYYPQPYELLSRLAKKQKINVNKIMLTAGSDESILALGKIYGSNTVIFPPTYHEYTKVKNFMGKLRKIYSGRSGKYQIRVKTYKNATLIFIANPNNPYGITQADILKKLIQRNPKSIVVIDETYGSFSNASMVQEVPNYKNLVVLKSFSKDYGMAGIRLGYLIANEEIIENVKQVVQTSNVSYLSIGAAISALENEWYFNKLRKKIIKEREDFYHFLLKNNFSVINSKINIVIIKFKSFYESRRFVRYLNKNSIIINYGDGKGNIGLDNNYVRIVIGSRQDMKITKSVIRNYLYESK